MSAAAPAPQRITNGYAQIPNSLIENQAFLTHAELSLALIVVRRGGSSGDDGTAVSDQTWERWTGLGARQKKYAIAGLQKKGLSVDGRGDQARYRWQPDMWMAYARQREREERAKTDGRKPAAVPAKKGAMVHPNCREGGCVMMRDTPAGNLVAMPLPAPPIEKAWPETLAMLRRPFPLVGAAYLGRLVAAAHAAADSITDAELAHAVKVAYTEKRTQHSEGLFLLTVPEAIVAIRRVPASSAPATAAGLNRGAIAEHVDKVLAVLCRDIWAPGDLLADIQRLRERVESADLDALDSEMVDLEKRVIQAAHVSLSDPQREKLNARVASQIKQYNEGRKARGGPMAGEHLEQLTRQFIEREILEHFKVPRLCLFYIEGR